MVKPVSIKDEKEKDIIEYLENNGYLKNFSYYVKELIKKDMAEKSRTSQPQTDKNKTGKKSLDFGM